MGDLMVSSSPLVNYFTYLERSIDKLTRIEFYQGSYASDQSKRLLKAFFSAHAATLECFKAPPTSTVFDLKVEEVQELHISQYLERGGICVAYDFKRLQTYVGKQFFRCKKIRCRD
jgi:hypothetical protein